ncbi:uncharacterized protein LOC118223304 isoform X1 [Anguilla anguilla]|uniref:uncharacterized protein LOC118223304 isoform X1 n=1 Tax=Anguilla anguilla TaxID=7936 RepID=UPI0015A902BD|nr:uncharacterized protein LOC118223304 isoform X1 [Anguilla anguilla]
MVNAMNVCNLCNVWSLVLISLAGRTEGYESMLASVKNSKRTSSYQSEVLGASDLGQRDTKSTPAAKPGRMDLSDFQTRFPVPRVIERLQGLVPAVLPRAENTMTSTLAQSPQAETAALVDVSVNCSSTGFTVRVKRNFFGFAVTPSELTIGRTCKSNGVDESSDDLLFTYPLTSCDNRQEKLPGHTLYKYALHFVPEPTHLPVRWARCLTVDIECRVKSVHQVHLLAVRPTWATPARKMLQAQMPGYGIQTMNEGWTSPSPSSVFLLGQRVHFQVFAVSLPAGGRLYVDRCHASTAPNPDASVKHPVIENYGCMVHSKREGSSSGFCQRTDRTINFVLEAFQFDDNSTAQVFLHCHLFVAVGGPTSTAKSCTYSRKERRWKEISGRDSECDCCDSQCRLSGGGRPLHEGYQSSGPLVFAPVGPETKRSTPPTHHKQGEAVLPKSRLEEEEEEVEEEEEDRGAVFQDFEEEEWPGEYEYAYVYEEDRYRGDGSHTPSTKKALQSGEGVELGGENMGSTFQKEVMGMREEIGEKAEAAVVEEVEGAVVGEAEGPISREEEGAVVGEKEKGLIFGEEKGPVVGEKEKEGPVVREEELDGEMVQKFKAGMGMGEKPEEGEWPEFDEKIGGGPVFGEEEELSGEEVPSLKAVMGEENVEGQWPVFGNGDWPMFNEKIGEWPMFEKIGEGPVVGEKEFSGEVVPTFKALMGMREKTGDGEWPDFGEETWEGEWPMLREEETHREVGPEFKAVIGMEEEMGKGVAKMFGEGEKSLVKEQSKFMVGKDGGVGEGPTFGKEVEPVEHYGLSSGIGDAKFLSGGDWLASRPWHD